MVLLFAFSSFVTCTVRADENENTAQVEEVRQSENKSEPEFIAEVDVAPEQENLENTAQQVPDITGPPMEGDDWLKIIGEVEETEDRRIVYEIAKEVTAAYFQGDLETIKKHLVADYAYGMDTYLDSDRGKLYGAEAVTIYGIKGFSNVGEEVGESCTVEVEFLPSEEMDFLYYFFMTFDKQKDGWIMSAYGLTG